MEDHVAHSAQYCVMGLPCRPEFCLKDKFGTRALPTAEIDLVGAATVPVGTLGGGVRKLTGLLNVARFWAAIGAPAGVGQLFALARDYTGKREVFGSHLRVDR